MLMGTGFGMRGLWLAGASVTALVMASPAFANDAAADAAALASWRDEATAQGLSSAINGAWPAARALPHGAKCRAQHGHPQASL